MISCESEFVVSPQDSGSFQQTIVASRSDQDVSHTPPLVPFNVTACSSSDDSHSTHSRPSKLTSYSNPADILPISISSINANRMLEASREFNLALKNVEHDERTRPDVCVDKTLVQEDEALLINTKDNNYPTGNDPLATIEESAETEDRNTRIMNFSRQQNGPIQKLFVQAVQRSKHPLLEAFLRQMRGLGMSEIEIEACLLLFADMGKSSKILAGFEILSAERDSVKEASILTCTGQDISDSQLQHTCEMEAESVPKNDGINPVRLSCSEIRVLLKCFMTSISICMDTGSKDFKANELISPSHDDTSTIRPSKFPRKSTNGSPDRSPTGHGYASTPSLLHDDWTLSETILKEIQKIASFASLQMMEFVQKQYPRSSASASNENTVMVGFDQFGEWYNSGGFSSVPWLELLDLNKWDFERRDALTQVSPSFNLENSNENGVEKRASDITESRNDKCSPYLSERKSEVIPHFTKPTRTLISFDFSDRGKGIKITEENLIALQRLVYLTGLENRTPEEILAVLLRFSTPRNYSDSIGKMILHRSDFGRCIRLIVPLEVSMHFSSTDAELISLYFSNFFNCFSYGSKEYGLNSDYVDAIELTIGLSFFCKGKKSTKLANTFDMLDEKKIGFLNRSKVLRYIRSYLTTLAGISLLSSNTDISMEQLRIQLAKPSPALLEAALEGARWTLDHFIKSLTLSGQYQHQIKDEYSFELFAGWYTNGGYNYAPWLEFLDLKKFFSLLSTSEKVSKEVIMESHKKSAMSEVDTAIPPTDGPINLSMQPPQPSSQVLFSFPLANRQSLVVLKEDASYVYSVVTSLYLVKFTPEDMWRSLCRRIRSLSHMKPVPMKTFELDKNSFVTFVSDILSDRMNARSFESLASIKETIGNFYLSFDLEQKNRVAGNQLMGGLTLLCQGKKSTKLSFSFGIFDGSNEDIDFSVKSQSLDGRELFYFLRSFLIVMFSCCKQSLQLSSAAVARNISDTAYTVTDNVMRYQWRTKAKSRVDFDEFGEWYNQGGFEAAPWLELLDLSKWALKDKASINQDTKSSPTSLQSAHSTAQVQTKRPKAAAYTEASKNDSATNKQTSIPHIGNECPPPPPDDHFDPDADDFFDENIAMDGIDDYDFDFNDISEGLSKEPIGPITASEPSTSNACGNPLNFQILSGQDHGGFLINVSSRRVSLLRRVLSESKICQIDVSAISNIIISKATSKKLSKEYFMAVIKNVPLSSGTSEYSKSVLNELYSALFDAFDVRQTGKVDGKVLVCGCSVLCHGRKSDKLEFAFELFEKGQVGLSQTDMIRYLESFVNVLLTVSSCPLGGESSEAVISSIHGSRKSNVPQLTKVAHIGCSWAATQVFSSEIVKRSGSERIGFETFASWYTTGGYTSIPWLELLDLRKWILADHV